MNSSNVLAGLLSALAAGSIWMLIAQAGGKVEAWDSGLYWSVGQPALLLSAFAIGAAYDANPWVVGIAGAFAQAVALTAGAEGDLGLLPLGLVLLLVLSLAGVLTAYIGAKLRRTLAG